MSNRIICVLTMCLWSCNMTNEPTQAISQEKTNSIDHLAIRYEQLNRFSGNITIADEGRIVYTKNYGLADYENQKPFTGQTSFKIGEITKVITGSITEELVAQNKLSLSDHTSDYLPSLEYNLTIGEILLQNDNADFNNLGRLLEKLTDKSFEELIQEFSADKELENTYYKKNESELAIGYLFSNHRGEGLELHKSPTYDLEESFSSLGIKSTGIDLIRILSSTSKQIDLDGYLENDGFSYAISNDTTKNLSVVVLSNRRHPVAGEISNSIKAILEDKEYELPLPREPYDIDKNTLKDFAGNYSINENATFEIFTFNDSLFVQMGPNKVHLVPQSQNQFYMKQMDAAMRFNRDSTGRVNSAQLLNGFIDSNESARRIK